MGKEMMEDANSITESLLIHRSNKGEKIDSVKRWRQ